MKLRRAFLLLGALLGLGAAYIGMQYWRAASAESLSEKAQQAAGEIRFAWQPWEPVAPAGWRTIATPADFRDALVWRDRLYIAGSNTLFRYTSDGALEKTWRCGFELPPAPLTALAAGDELWIGTEGEGLLNFDGERFRRLLPSSRPLRKIRAVLLSATGAVLLATDTRGVLRFDGNTLRPLHPALDGEAITSLAGEETDLWAGTRQNGALRLHAGQVDRVTEAEGLPDASVHSIAVDGDRAWAGTATGIAEYRDGRFVRVLAAGVLARSLLVRNGELHAATLSDGWLRIPLDPRAPRQAAFSAPQEEEETRKVVASGDAVYILRPDGISAFIGGRRTEALRLEPTELAHGNISALATDSGNRLWVGYFDRGLDILDSQRHRSTHIEDERVFCVNRIVRSGDGQVMAVATANGLVLLDAAGSQRQVITKADGLIANHVTDVTARGGSWIAATPAGITFLAGGVPRSVYAFQGLVNNHVYTLGQNGQRLLAGTLGGLSLLESETVRASYNTANSGLKTNWVTALAVQGEDWFAGTYGGGVQRFRGNGEWQRFEDMPPNVVVNPNAMTATPQGIYAGTLEHGLLAWDRQGARWRTIRAGLPSANVTAVLYHDNTLYVGTDNGLVAVPESALGN